MRVIVISVALLIAFVIMAIGFVKSERTPYPVAETVTTIVDNPFANDVKKEKSVALPTLPPSGTTANASANVADKQVSNTTDTANSTDASANTASTGESVIQNGSASVENKPSSSTNNGLTSDAAQNTMGVSVPEAGMDEKPRKLGLAMLELEKEKRRNLIGVIVNEKNTQNLSESQIKAMYLDQLNQWQDGSNVLLFNLPLGDKYRDKFSQKILNMTALEADQAESTRREKHTIKNRIEVKASNIVVSYVEQHSNAIAYVPLSMVHEKSNVRVILVINL